MALSAIMSATIAAPVSEKFVLRGSDTKLLADNKTISNQFLIADMDKQRYIKCYIKHNLYGDQLAGKGCWVLKISGDFGGDWKDAQYEFFKDKTWQTTSPGQQAVIRLDRGTGMLSKCSQVGNDSLVCFTVDASQPAPAP
ncbi:hypothetical protein K788_00009585 (plasmid) [Paraburkholderia caribensis MBA4]|uniref:Uncharacterized protein n=2 Tax=Paraburkholderia caribensis TaxID=75105 RepID=A0A0N7JW93_9BURK|nr:hypothetical protein K788_00009585 [Paraburkholderia caribensis MBA4]